tara:strand:- start:2177 stop:2515 length:339 start_codon:yes stop_codon:yes gene_type:complete
MQSSKLLSGDYTNNSVRLWQSVILQALLDCGNLSRSVNPSKPDWWHRQITEEARQWFRNADDDFEDVCALAQLDSNLIRKFAMRVARGDAKAKKSLVEWRDWFKRFRKEDND